MRLPLLFFGIVFLDCVVGDVANHKNRKLLPESSCGVDEYANRTEDGKTRMDEFPWLALVRVHYKRSKNTAYACLGALISHRYVLTMDYCASSNGRTYADQVRLGEYRTGSDPDCNSEAQCAPFVDDIDVSERITMPKNPQEKVGQDVESSSIALLRLAREPKLSPYVRPICLPLDTPDLEFSGTPLYFSGWGGKENEAIKGHTGLVKRKMKLSSVPRAECAPHYFNNRRNITISDKKFCAIGKEVPCFGEGGGPLMAQLTNKDKDVRWFVVGVDDFGRGVCDNPKAPDVFAKVIPHNQWILDNLKE